MIECCNLVECEESGSLKVGFAMAMISDKNKLCAKFSGFEVDASVPAGATSAKGLSSHYPVKTPALPLRN